MSLRLKFSAVVLVLSSLAAAHAAVVFSNPYNDSGYGDCIYNTTCGPYEFSSTDDTYAAQQFTLATSATITSASFTSIVVGSTGSSVNYAFYTSNGLPDTLLASGSSSFTSIISAGCDPGDGCPSNDYTYSFNVNSITLGPGTYYFAIQEVTSNFYDFLAEGTAITGDAESDDGGATWYAPYPQGVVGYEPSVAVSLYGAATPEPSAIYLLGSGLAAMAALRRRLVRK